MSILQIWRSLWLQKFRTSLAILGVGIGTAAVVGLLYTGLLSTAASIQEIKDMGTQFIAITVNDSDYSFSAFDLEKVRQRHQGLQDIIPLHNSAKKISIAGASVYTGLVASSSNLQKALAIKMQSGRFIAKADQPLSTCVIGENIAKNFAKLGVINLIGRNVFIDGSACLVVGQMELQPANFFLPVNLNDSVLTNISEHNNEIKNILINFKDDIPILQQGPYVIADLHTLVPNANFFERSPKFLLDHITQEKNNHQWLLGIIAGISLLVSGIGIMNIMLVSVVERKSEIGLRLAVGATKQVIALMFLHESLLLSVFGGIIGIMFALGISYILAVFSGWQFVFYIWPLFIGFTMSLIVGVFFGYYPAKKASDLDPIQAIRGVV